VVSDASAPAGRHGRPSGDLPSCHPTDATTAGIRATHADLAPDQVTDHHVRIAGHLELIRRQGRLTFATLRDDAGTIRHCLDCGASGFIPKSQPVEAIRDAIRKIMGGQVWLPPDLDLSNVPTGETAELVSRLATLTPQQVRVLMMLGEGLLNKQIAFKLGVSEATIKAHVSAILQKLGVDSRTQAVIAISKIGASADWPRMTN